MTGSDGDDRRAGPAGSPAAAADAAGDADGPPADPVEAVPAQTDPVGTSPADSTVAAPGAPATPGPPERHTLLALLDAVGGPAALVDSAAPTIVFALTYTLDSRHLRPALVAAVGVAVLLAIWRLVRRQSMHTVAGGLLGIALAAGIALATGRASDYYLVSIVRSLGLAVFYAVSALIRWPIIGVVVGAAAGRPGGFREDPEQLRAYTRVTWLWVGLFVLRLAVRGPLLLANAFTWLSVTDVVMGWPLFLGWTALTYVLLRRWLHGSVWEAAREGILARNARTAASGSAGSAGSTGSPGLTGFRGLRGRRMAGGGVTSIGPRDGGGQAAARGGADDGGSGGQPTGWTVGPSGGLQDEAGAEPTGGSMDGMDGIGGSGRLRHLPGNTGDGGPETHRLPERPADLTGDSR